jgi:hypothetical protein
MEICHLRQVAPTFLDVAQLEIEAIKGRLLDQLDVKNGQQKQVIMGFSPLNNSTFTLAGRSVTDSFSRTGHGEQFCTGNVLEKIRQTWNFGMKL